MQVVAADWTKDSHIHSQQALAPNRTQSLSVWHTDELQEGQNSAACGSSIFCLNDWEAIVDPSQ